MKEWKMLLIVVVVGMLVIPMMPVKGATQATIKKVNESGEKGGWGPTWITIVPLRASGYGCVGGAAKAYVFGHYGDTIQIRLYWRNVQLVSPWVLPDSSSLSKPWIKKFGYWWYLHGIIPLDDNNNYIFLSGDFKGRLLINGEVVKETGWVHLTKNSVS